MGSPNKEVRELAWSREPVWEPDRVHCPEEWNSGARGPAHVQNESWDSQLEKQVRGGGMEESLRVKLLREN